MTYIMTHVLLGVMNIDYSLAYVASSRHTSKGNKTAAQDAIMTLKAITIEVNTKCHKLLSMRSTKLNVASCLLCTLQVAEYALDQTDLNDTSCNN